MKASLRVVEQVEQPDEDFEVLSISSGASTVSGTGITGSTAAATTTTAATATGAVSFTSSFAAITTSTSNTSSNHQQTTAPSQCTFEICVDCYHMMEGVVVCANESELAAQPNSAATVAYHKKPTSPQRHQSGI